MGNPEETEKEIAHTMQLIRRTSPDYFIANVLVPYPGSKLYEDMLGSGRLKEDYWRRVTLQGRAVGPTPLANDHIPRNKLIQFRNQINRMPYMRIRSNIFKLRKIRTVHDLKRGIHTLLNSYLSSKM